MVEEFYQKYQEALSNIAPRTDLASETIAAILAENAATSPNSGHRYYQQRNHLAKRAALIAACCILVVVGSIYGLTTMPELQKSTQGQAFAQEMELETPSILIPTGSVMSLEEGNTYLVVNFELHCSHEAGTQPFLSVEGDGVFVHERAAEPIDLGDKANWLKTASFDSAQEMKGSLIIEVELDSGERAHFDRTADEAQIEYARTFKKALDTLSNATLIVGADGFNSSTYSFTPEAPGDWPTVRRLLRSDEGITVNLTRI